MIAFASKLWQMKMLGCGSLSFLEPRRLFVAPILSDIVISLHIRWCAMFLDLNHGLGVLCGRLNHHPIGFGTRSAIVGHSFLSCADRNSDSLSRAFSYLLKWVYNLDQCFANVKLTRIYHYSQFVMILIDGRSVFLLAWPHAKLKLSKCPRCFDLLSSSMIRAGKSMYWRQRINWRVKL